MSRLRAISTGLYYPTPLRVVSGIAARLDILHDAQPYTLLDHSCGTGEALSFLARQLTTDSHRIVAPEGRGNDSATIHTYGIELDHERADASRQRLSSALQTNALTARVSRGRVGLLLSNPPYDASGDGDGRIEYSFLKTYTPTLMAGGVLVHIIGLNQLAPCARYLARTYRDLAVYRFPDPEYRPFRQIVIFGVRHDSITPDPDMVQYLVALAHSAQTLPILPCPPPPELRRQVEAWGQAGIAWERERDVLTDSDADDVAVGDDGTRYRIPPDESDQPLRITTGQYSEGEALRDAVRGGVWANQTFRDAIIGDSRTQTHARPLLPLREGQAALLVSVGLLNNMVVSDDTAHVLVKGALTKEYVQIEAKTNECGDITMTREREVIRARLTSLDLATGETTQVAPDAMAAFITRFKGSITRRMRDTYPPLYTPGDTSADPTLRKFEAAIATLGRKPKGAQAQAIIGVALSLTQQRGTILSSEQGTGKSFMAISAAYLAGMRRIVIICPPHLVQKWVREVQLAVPGANARIVKSIGDLDSFCQTAQRSPTTIPCVAIISRERLKLAHRWRGAVDWRMPHPYPRDASGKPIRDPYGDVLKLPHCPRCGVLVADRDGEPLDRAGLNQKKLTCGACGEALWTASSTLIGDDFTGQSRDAGNGPRRVALSEYIKKKWRGFFDLLIADEIHEYKGMDSAQGLAAATLSACCTRTLALTGTLGGGYSTNLFPLLWRFSDSIRAHFGLHDGGRWAEHYGIIERQTRYKEGEPQRVGDGAMSDRRQTRAVQLIERPGINPAVLLHMIGHTVFLRLADVDAGLPPYSEHIVTVGLDTNADGETSHACAYAKLSADMYAAVRESLREGSTRLLGALLQSLLAWPDNPVQAEIVTDPRTDDVIAFAPALDPNHVYPKEVALLALYRRERQQGRKLLVFVSNTGTRDITPRLKELLAKEGARVAILKSDTVAPDKREEWVAGQIRGGSDVLITNPRIVQTGLDLLDYTTLCFYQVEYSTYVLRQASRRSWRIGQTQPIRVYHMAYADTLQAQALRHIARKVQAANMLEGDLGGDGLLALAEEEGEAGTLMLTLARAITGNVVAGQDEGDDGWQNLTLDDLEPVEVAPAPTITPRTQIIETKQPSWDDLRAVYGTATTARRKRATPTTDSGQLDLFALFDRRAG